MKNGLSVMVDNFAKVTAGINMMVTTRVMVGVPAEEALRKPEEGEPGEPINNAALAYIHDNGAPEVGIPARPFMKPGISDAEDRIDSGLRKVGENALAGKAEQAERGLHAVGLVASAAIKRRITTGPFQPLAESTLAARRRRGRTGTKPLIDTSQLRGSINYVLRRISAP